MSDGRTFSNSAPGTGIAEPSVDPTQGVPSRQPANEQVLIQLSDIDIPRPDAVLIENSTLMDQLIRNQDETLRFLSEDIAPVDIDEVSVDRHGRVVIANQHFRELMLVRLQINVPQSTNGLCGNVKCAMEI